MATPESIIADLHASASTGQNSNTFFRHSQLKSLNDALRKNAQILQQVIQKDTSSSNTEVAIEFAVTLSIIREHYNSLDPKRELENDHQISLGHDAADAREPWGVVYIEPNLQHTPLFSSISAISAAITAGNCVVLKVYFKHASGNR